jgi:ribosomal protein L40E
MTWSMDAAGLPERRNTRVVCDVCGAYSTSARGARCRTCSVGVLRYLSELYLVREARSRERRAARSGPRD